MGIKIKTDGGFIDAEKLVESIFGAFTPSINRLTDRVKKLEDHLASLEAKIGHDK